MLSRWVHAGITLVSVLAVGAAYANEQIPDAVVDREYRYVFPVVGGEGNLTFSLSGALPSGLNFLTHGALRGTPTRIGTYTFEITINDELGNRVGPVTHELEVLPPITDPPVINPDQLPDAIVGEAYRYRLSAAGGNAAVTWRIEGLPPGLETQGPTIRGVPSQAGSFTPIAQLSTANGHFTTSKTLQLTVSDQQPPQLLSLPQITAYLGIPIAWRPVFDKTVTLTASQLPPWASLGANTLTGIPDRTGRTEFSLTATANDGASIEMTPQIDVRPPPFVQPLTTTTSNARQVIGAPCALLLVTLVEGGVPPYRFDQTAGLPGCQLDEKRLVGAHTQVGQFTWQGLVTDQLGMQAEIRVNVEIQEQSP